MADVDRMLSEVAKLLQGQAFAYLVRKGDGHDPYNLRVVPAAAVRTGRYKDQHYTMSEAGVTAFRKVDRWRTDTQFTPLVAWRRECALYKSVSSLPFFRDYSKWRTYRLWKHELNAVKRNECARQLNERAFILDDHFSRALRSIAAKCDNLRTLRMHELQPSVEGASLAAIADGQHRHLRAFAKRLDAFRDGVVSDVLAACLAARTQLEEKLDATSAAELIGDAEAYTASPPTQQQQQQRRGAPAVTASGSRGRSAEDEAAEAAEAVAAVRSAAAGGATAVPTLAPAPAPAAAGVAVASPAAAPAAAVSFAEGSLSAAALAIEEAQGATPRDLDQFTDANGGGINTKQSASRRSFQQRAQLRRLCERSARFVRCVQFVLHSTLLQLLLTSLDDLREMYSSMVASLAASSPSSALAAAASTGGEDGEAEEEDADLAPLPIVPYSRASVCDASLCRRAGLMRDGVTPPPLLELAEAQEMTEFENAERSRKKEERRLEREAAELRRQRAEKARRRGRTAGDDDDEEGASPRKGTPRQEQPQTPQLLTPRGGSRLGFADVVGTPAAAETGAEEEAEPRLVLFQVTLVLELDSRTVGVQPSSRDWEALLRSFVSKPVDVLSAVGSLMNEPELQEFIQPQPISSSMGEKAASAPTAEPAGAPPQLAPSDLINRMNADGLGAASLALETSGIEKYTPKAPQVSKGTLMRRAQRAKRMGSVELLDEMEAAGASLDDTEDSLKPEIGGGLRSLLVASAAPHVTALRELVRSNYAALGALVHEYAGHGALYKENGRFRALEVGGDAPSSSASLEAFRELMLRFSAQIDLFDAMAPAVSVGIFSADASALKERFMPSPRHCLSELRALIPRLADQTSEAILDEVRSAEEQLRRKPEGVAGFVSYALFLRGAPTLHEALEKRWEGSEELHELLTEFEIEPSEGSKATRKALAASLNGMNDILANHQAAYDEKLTTWSKKIVEGISALRSRAADERLIAEDPLLFDGKTLCDEAFEHLARVRVTVRELTDAAAQFEEWQTTLSLAVTPCDEVKSLAASMRIAHEMWACVDDAAKKNAEWRELPMHIMEPSEIEQTAVRYQRAISAAERALPSNTVLPMLRAELDTFRALLPCVVALRNPNLKPVHYDKLDAALGRQIPRGEALTVAKALELNLHSHGQLVAKMASDATQEAALHDMIDKVREQWKVTEFATKPFKDSKDATVLGAVDDVMQTLEETQLVMQTVMGSPYVTALRAEAEGWHKKLQLFSDVLDEWLACQRSWMYLESIFAAPDLQRQLPAELKMFQSVDVFWKKIMKGVEADPDALRNATQPNILDDLRKANETLGRAQKRVEDHLETKRAAFPRFCFLSNDELLEILAQCGRNPQAVQPHLIKCFDSIKALEFAEGSVILSMLSPEGEGVPFAKPLKARGAVEEWLCRVEESMQLSLHRLLKDAIVDAPATSTERLSWCRRHKAQMVLTAAQVAWGSAVANAFEMPEGERLDALGGVLAECRSQLADLAREVAGPLDKLLRRTLVALITADVHARDITETMFDSKVDSPTSFTWQMQLRIEWRREDDPHTLAAAASKRPGATDDVGAAAAPAADDAAAAKGGVDLTTGGSCVVVQASSSIPFAFEYQGVPTRLVVTPLTDRCWMTLTGALHMSLGGAPAGPAGTGKTESVKDLAKGIARQCVVYNCSDQLDYKTMGKLFSGVSQCGCWTCLDEFNRINIEVLSVVAQQLLTIRQALLAKAPTCVLEGRRIAVVPGNGVFITMNPGYAGRTELPDNLKALFRPVSMMVPDYALIAEIMLYAEGFVSARPLALKMVKMYKLCSEQLSQQDHYDYGMRQVKSVLVMAGGQKRGAPDLDEALALIRAMQEANVPRFLAEDLPLFHAIVSDLYPTVKIFGSSEYANLETKASAELVARGLQPEASFVGKVVELQQTLRVRFGVMLVGPAGGGKSTALETLRASLSSLRAEGSKDEAHQQVHTTVFNPKCVSMGELYGEFNELTQEWKDGLASSFIRQAVVDTQDSPELRWTVFDGPVDALWIENMNTVLDDNMTLCLANAERIKLNHQMRMLFEVQDLAAASPATVSRCGMVFYSEQALGWRPLVVSWAERALSGPLWNDAARAHVVGLFDAAVPPALSFVRMSCKELVPTVDMQLVAALTSLFESLLPRSGLLRDEGWVSAGKPLEADEELVSTDGLAKLFVFCLCWSVGGGIDDESRVKFDEFVRERIDKEGSILPTSGRVHDYALAPPPDGKEDDATTPGSPAKKGGGGGGPPKPPPKAKPRKVQSGPPVGPSFVTWLSLVPAFAYSPSMAFFDVLVPTVDTVRSAFLLTANLEAAKPTLLCGGSGVGKSVLTQRVLSELSKGGEWLGVQLNFSAQTSAGATQSMIEERLDKRRRTVLGPPPGKRMALFVDDVNMPALETYGAAPPVELLRLLLDRGGVYDRSKPFWKDVADVTVVCACGPPGGGRNPLTPRFVRHHHVLCLPQPSAGALRQIFGGIFGGFVEGASREVRECVKPLVESSIMLYDEVAAALRPIPAKPHYTFNLRDLSKVAQGVLRAKAGGLSGKGALLQLWWHECLRTFHDRLVDADDREFLREKLLDLARMHWKGGGIKIVEEDLQPGALVYAAFGATLDDVNERGGERGYESVHAPAASLPPLLTAYLDEYTNSIGPMPLVFFPDAIDHVCRLARILTAPRGSAMLVGVGGSGKQSLTKFAAFLCGQACHSIELRKGYSPADFREDLKALFVLAGGDKGTHLTFLFTDSQVVSEALLEDIDSILNSGEVPGLFATDELDQILNSLRELARKRGMGETRDALRAFFVSRVRDQLHLVLAFSPVGEAFRNRCRQFPSLVNCTTLDWYDTWPEDALQAVSAQVFGRAAQEEGGKPPLIREDAPTRASLCTLASYVHKSVRQMAETFFEEQRRRTYVTPKSFLELLALYVSMLARKRAEVTAALERLEGGVSKLKQANESVADMKVELSELQPVLEAKSIETSKLLIEVQRETQAAAQQKALVERDKSLVAQTAEKVKALADDAQADLDKALPAFEAAIDSLKSLSKPDLIEVRGYAKPPPLVMKVMECVCILLGKKPDWDSAKKVLGDTNLLENLMNFDKDNIPPKVVKEINRYYEEPDFVPEIVERVSLAARSLCLWCRAMKVYNDMAQVVEPKKALVADARMSLDAEQKKLQLVEAQLAEVIAKVESLQATCDATMVEKKQLQEAADTTARRLLTADKLTSGLAEEAVRWTETAGQLKVQLGGLTGSVFVSAAFVAYAGPFTAQYRRQLLDAWAARCAEEGIQATASATDEFNLVKSLGEPVVVRQWQQMGLPVDDYSTENGILATKGKRWPLCIDPQGQANKWIRALESSARQLAVARPGEKNLLRSLEVSVRSGGAVLLEDVGEALDPSLETVLAQAVYHDQGRTLLKVGDTAVDFNDAFRLYITTKLPNPHYLPEVCIKVTLINFTVTLSGLEDQLLGLVVREERPQLEQQKDELIVALANDAKLLNDLEEQILRLLSASEGNILDDDNLVETLSSSKVTARTIGERVVVAEATQKEINAARASYLPAASRGSLLYFVTADLAHLDPMYQFSLNYFSSLFLLAVQQAAKAEDLSQRLANIMDHATLVVFDNVSRGLFEAHKATFAFLVAAAILRANNDVSDDEWLTLLLGAGPTGAEKAPYGAPPPALGLEPQQWQLVGHLEQSFDVFGGLASHIRGFEKDIKAWEAWQKAAAPWKLAPPGRWGEASESGELSSFGMLLLVKALRPDLLLGAMQHLVATSLGARFAESPPLQIASAFADAKPSTPLIFVLTSGADPLAALVKFAQERSYAERLRSTSLGQGQGPIAEQLIVDGRRTGDWVLLQNCHLAVSWMPELERLVEELGADTGSRVHPDFRLWLTSFPNPTFPVPVLQNAVKMTYEPPKGLKANLLSTWRTIDEATFERCPQCTPTYRKLLFGLTALHALLQERRKFGPLGFNIRYDFNETDREISIETLAMLLEQQPEPGNVPWDALRYVTGHIHYGGRVTDDWDRRCVLSLLERFYSDEALEDGYSLDGSSAGGEADADDPYRCPPAGSLDDYRAFVAALPLDDAVGLFGLHENAKITHGLAEAAGVIRTIVDIQPRLGAGGGGGSAEATATALAKRLADELPPPMLRTEALRGALGVVSEDGKVDVGSLTSLQLVLLHEVDHFNHLLHVVASSLKNLQLAVQGVLVMSADLERVFSSMLRGEVPAAWAKAAYPSLKPLASWHNDLRARVGFIRSWLVAPGPPDRFPLPYFFYTQGFLTGVLQMHARKHKVPIDFLSFAYRLLDEPSPEIIEAANSPDSPAARRPTAAAADGAATPGTPAGMTAELASGFVPEPPPDDGVLVEGLFLAGARYNRTLRVLQPPRPKQMVDPLPAIHFEPVENQPRDESAYECPLYKTSARAGVLSTTGASTNFVVALSIPTREPPEKWVRMGIAALCQTDD